MVAALQADTHPNTDETTLDVAYRRMHGTDGIREDYTGGAFNPTLSTSAPTVGIASAGRSLLVDGNLLTFAANAVLDPRDAVLPNGNPATMPAGSQTRRDLVVARYTTATEILSQRGSLVVLPGVPLAAPTYPVPTRSPGGVWEVPVCGFTLPPSGLLTGLVKMRRWAEDHQLLEDSADLHGPVGCTRDWRGSVWHRRLDADGAPVWAEISFASSVYAGTRLTPDPSFVRDASATDILVTAIAVPARPYRRVFDVRAGFLPLGFESGTAYADVWIQLRRNGVVVSDGGGPGRVRAAAASLNTTGLVSRSFSALDADAAYEVRLVTSTPAGAVRFSADPRYTYAEVTTRYSA